MQDGANPEVVPSLRYGTFSQGYKLRMLAEAGQRLRGVSKSLTRYSFCRCRPHWKALFAFVIIVAVSHWQLLRHLSSHVFGRPFEDAFGILWDLDWARRALFELRVSPFYTPDVFYPHGFYVSASSPPMWWFIFFSPLTALLGPVATYNLINLAAVILAGFGMYLLVTHLGGKWLEGIIAGSIYIVAPVFTIRLAGHTDILLSSLWLPYLALFTHKALEQPRSASWLPAGLFWALACLGHWQFVFLSPLLPLAIFGLGSAPLRLRQRALLLFKSAGTALAVIAPFLALTLNSRQQMYSDVPAFSITSGNAFSLSIDRLFVPNPLNSIWGGWSRATFPISSEASFVSIGYMALLMAIFGMATRWPHRRTYLAMLLLAVVGALGITFHWNEQTVILPLSLDLAKTLRPLVEQIVGPELMPEGPAIVLPMPLAFLFRISPLVGLTRVWARFMIVGMLAIGVLAGFGVTSLLRRFRRFAYPATGLILGVILLEGLITPYDNFTEVRANQRPVDQWLAEQPQLSLIEYPLPYSDKLAMYRQSIHRQQIVNGYASIMPSHYAEALPTLGIWPNPAAVELLRTWGIDYVLVNGSLNDDFQQDTLPRIRLVSGLCLIRTDTEPEYNRQTLLFMVLPERQSCQ